MNILIILLYIIGSLLLLLIALLLFILLIPFRYNIAGGYKNRPWIKVNLRCSAAFIVAGTWDAQEEKVLQTKFILLGIPINFDPQKFKVKRKKVKRKAEEKKRERKKIGISQILLVLDKDLRVGGLALIQDLLRILKPDLVYLNGKIGFDEPHLTGWLAAAAHSLDYCCKEVFIELEPTWENESYEFETVVNGRIRTGLILIKIGWFMIKLWTRRLFKSYGKKQLATSA